VFIRSVHLLVTFNVVPSSPILIALIMHEILYSETSVLTRATRHKIKQDGILHSYRRKNLKSYIALTGWTVHLHDPTVFFQRGSRGVRGVWFCV
jgi:hypothetical protein